MPDVFVSYSRRDAEFVNRLAEDLNQRGKDVWVDVEGIRDAERFPDALRRAIESSDAFVFVITPDSVRSEYCEQEVAHAAGLNKRIVPLALREVPDEEIPEEIRLRNWIPVNGGGDTGADRVLGAIETDLDWEHQHTRMTVKALEWDGAGRDSSFLLRGSDLSAGEQWLAQGAGKDPGPTELEQKYLLAARQAASRRQRMLVGASLAVAVVAIGLLIFALISRGQAVTAKTSADAQALAAVSETQQSVDPERAVLLAMAAVRIKPTYGTLGTMFALRAALDASTIRYALPRQSPQACGGPGVSYDPAPRSNLLAEGLCNGEIVLANATTGHVMRRVRPSHLPGSILLNYTADGSVLVSANGPRVLALDPVTGAVRATSPRLPGLSTLAVDPRAPLVAAIGYRQLDLWNIATGRTTVIRETAAQTRQFGGVIGIAFSPDGRRVALATSSNSNGGGAGLVMYDLAHRRIVGLLGTQTSAAAFSPDGRWLAVGEDFPASGSIVLLDARTLKPVRTLVSVADVAPSSIAFSPKGTELAYGFADGTAGLVSIPSGQRIDSYEGETASVNEISFRPDGDVVATSSGDGTVRAWRAGGLALRVVPTAGTLAYAGNDSAGFVTVDSPGAGPGQGVVAQQWSDDGLPIAPPLVLSRTPNVNALLLGPGGKVVVIFANGPNSQQRRVVVWNVEQRRIERSVPIAQLPSGSEPVMSPNGDLLEMNVPAQQAAPSPITNYRLEVFNLITGRQRTLASETACGGGWDGFAFSPSSSEIASGTFCGDQIGVYDLVTGRRLGAKLDLNGGQLARMTFSPDGRRLAIASWNGNIEVSPVPVHGKPTVLTENTKGVPGIAYSPNGRYLATAGLDHTIRVFDARTLTELRVISQPSAAFGLGFTTDNQAILGYGADNGARLWDACTDCENPPALLRLAQSRVTRPLSVQERQEFGLS